MKKTFMRTMSVLLTFLMIFGQMTSVLATGQMSRWTRRLRRQERGLE